MLDVKHEVLLSEQTRRSLNLLPGYFATLHCYISTLLLGYIVEWLLCYIVTWLVATLLHRYLASLLHCYLAALRLVMVADIATAASGLPDEKR